MKLPANNIIDNHITVIGDPSYPCWVIKGTRKNLMIDAGLNLLGPLYINSLNAILGNKDFLNYLFLTHSHYDHLGAASFLKKIIPALVIGAHERVEQLLRKEAALELMNRLSDSESVRFAGHAGQENVRISPLSVDLLFREGDEIELGGLTCRVYEVPGHTRDSLAYFIPETGALFTGEAAGVPQINDEPQVEFLASYEDYLASLEKMLSLHPRILCVAHGGYFTGADAMDFLRRSHDATQPYRRLIESSLDKADGNIKQAVSQIVSSEYDTKGTITQERSAYITNLTAQVSHIAELRQK
ncbi:MAG TPA: MBL fold metallo-hydrolase [Smithellaceae bacterium]|nr:MBL fold metallo-hydrolase [Smithellaceae bacterium]